MEHTDQEKIKLPKTKYLVYLNKALSYTCVTTTRPEEEVVSILKERYQDKVGYARIYKIVNGQKQLLYKKYKHNKQGTLAVIDTDTGIIYPSSKDVAEKLKIGLVMLRKRLAMRHKNKGQFQYLLDYEQSNNKAPRVSDNRILENGSE